MIFLQPVVWVVYTLVGFPSLPVHISNSWCNAGATSVDPESCEPGTSDCTVTSLQRRSSTSSIEEAVTTKKPRKTGRLVVRGMGERGVKNPVRSRQQVSCPHQTVSSLRRKALAKSLKDVQACSEDPIPNRPPWVS